MTDMPQSVPTRYVQTDKTYSSKFIKIIQKEKCQQKLLSFSWLISYFQQKLLSITYFKLSRASHVLTTSYLFMREDISRALGKR